MQRDPTHFGEILNFLRDGSHPIAHKPLFSSSPLSCKWDQTTTVSGPTTEIIGPHIHSQSCELIDELQQSTNVVKDHQQSMDGIIKTIALVRELDYYGLLNFVLPKQVEEDLNQWMQDFSSVFTLQRYHHQVARLWIDAGLTETDKAGRKHSYQLIL